MTSAHLNALESQAIYILREAYSRRERVALLWSLGKDSNVLIWLARKAFFGRVPFPVVHIDTGAEFPEVYAFRERCSREWGLDLVAVDCPPLEAADPGLPPAARFAARKSLGLKRCLAAHDFDAVIAGIRRDEQAIRAKERVFSPRDEEGTWHFRDQPPELWDQYNTDLRPGAHLRVHPLLQWTELDVWRYVAREGIPLVSLYFARNGKRYRSLGEVGTTSPIASQAATIEDIIEELTATRTAERGGRLMDHEAEDAFERLRFAGYL